MKRTIIQKAAAAGAIVAMALLTFAAQAQPPSGSYDLALKEAKPAAEAATRSVAKKRLNLTTKSSAWKANLVKQFTRSLASPIEDIREQTIQTIIFFATNHAADLNLSKAASELFAIYRWDKNEAHRIMALQALHAIGEGYSMQRLGEHLPHERSPRVRKHTKAVLDDYYSRK